MYHPRNNKLLHNARTLRKNMTKEERHLWFDFLRYCTPRFRRQELIGNYIADFYCSKARLVIELDGSQHRSPSETESDAQRTDYFHSLHVVVIRYTNTDLQQNFGGVCQNILEILKQRGFSPVVQIPDTCTE